MFDNNFSLLTSDVTFVTLNFSREAWRYQGAFVNRYKGALPGFGTACILFVAFCAYEKVFMKKDHHGEHH